jgi:hypothetical protein
MVTLLNQEDGGSNKVMLATSQDGVCWQRPLPQKIWVTRGKDGDFGAGCVSIGSHPVYKE